jgi:putative ABC transport system permease protein
MFTLVRDARIDLRYAMRLFARQPAVLLLTIAGLALGVGIATAAFSILNGAIGGEGLVDPNRAPRVVKTTERSVSTTWSYAEYLTLREGATRMQVEAVLGDDITARLASGEQQESSAAVAFVSGGFFAATGGRMALGRALEPADEHHAGAPPIVVSHIFWTSVLNRDPDAVGRTIWVGRAAGTIVGVAERGFSVPRSRLLWIPITAFGAVYNAGTRTPGTDVEVFGRLMPDVTLAEAEAQLSGVAASLPRGGLPGDSLLRVRLEPDEGLGRVSSTEAMAIAALVLAVIALVLLLTCANVATVLVSAAITREREMGVRKALGASRWRIVRQLVTESLALGTIAAFFGLMFASWAIPMIGRLIDTPAGADLRPDLTVYVFLVAVTVLTGIGAGLAPAWHGRGVDLVTPLKGMTTGNRRAPRRLRSSLVMTQAAVSVLLIVLSALFVRATLRSAAIDVGFNPEGLYSVTAGPADGSESGEARTRQFWTRAGSETASVPGVVSVTLAEITPFSGVTKTSMAREEPRRVIHLNRTRSDYFETVGLRLLAGRTYTPDEVASKTPVALVSESLARAYWPEDSPLGQMVPASIPMATTRPQIIGIVADAITTRLHERNMFAIYEPLDPASERSADLMLRVAPGAIGVIDQARQRLRAIDAQTDVRIVSIESLLKKEADQPRMLAALTGLVGMMAIVLCVIGLYGLTASVVGQRARELGIRVALGADTRQLLRLLMWDSVRPVVLGLALGAGVALAAGRVLGAAVFFGVSPHDPLAFAGAAVVLLAASMLAVLAPTRRAAAVDAASVLMRS